MFSSKLAIARSINTIHYVYLEIEFGVVTSKETEYAPRISMSALRKEITALAHTKVGNETAPK